MLWFERLTGFAELSPEQVRDTLRLEGTRLHSLANGRSFECGELEIVSLFDLQVRFREAGYRPEPIVVEEVVGDVQSLHCDPRHAGAVFQVASQFNLLEMASPELTPEHGIGIYELDPTQGPACAIAAGAGTIFRNYFVPVGEQVGQSADIQVDCLSSVGDVLGNSQQRLWEMKNGYALATAGGLREVAARLRDRDEGALDGIRNELRIGIQWNTQVTLRDCRHQVTQVYCSALPVAYMGHAPELWEPFARLILAAAYEATFLAAILNREKTGNSQLYLTQLGGGAFGNDEQWILGAIRRALTLYKDTGLRVSLVSYRRSQPAVRQLVEDFA